MMGFGFLEVKDKGVDLFFDIWDFDLFFFYVYILEM